MNNSKNSTSSSADDVQPPSPSRYTQQCECPHCGGRVSAQACGERIMYWCEECGSNNPSAPPSISVDAQPPAPAESAEVEKLLIDLLRAARGDGHKVQAIASHIDKLVAQRDALQDDLRILRASANTKMITEQQKRIDALVDFADDMYTLGDWMPDLRKKGLIELVQKMAHDVLHPSKPSNES